MKKSMTSAGVLLLLGTTVAEPLAGAQIELDRIVSRAAGQIITQSDIRQARDLRLVDNVGSDEAVQRALETRLLILHDLGRAAPLSPVASDALAERRAEWAASVGGESQVPALLARHGMSPGELDTWLRDDLRIRAYLGRQFGMLPVGERGRAIDDWLGRLRQRSDLR